MISIPSSTSIARYGYKDDILTIDFHKTGMYEYYGISHHEIEQIHASDEKSKDLLKLIKNKRFKKVDDSK